MTPTILYHKQVDNLLSLLTIKPLQVQPNDISSSVQIILECFMIQIVIDLINPIILSSAWWYLGFFMNI